MNAPLLTNEVATAIASAPGSCHQPRKPLPRPSACGACVCGVQPENLPAWEEAEYRADPFWMPRRAAEECGSPSIGAFPQRAPVSGASQPSMLTRPPQPSAPDQGLAPSKDAVQGAGDEASPAVVQAHGAATTGEGGAGGIRDRQDSFEMRWASMKARGVPQAVHKRFHFTPPPGVLGQGAAGGLKVRLSYTQTLEGAPTAWLRWGQALCNPFAATCQVLDMPSVLLSLHGFRCRYVSSCQGGKL